MAEVVMPRLSDSMEEGTIVRWLKGDGDSVSRGDELVEIETDKATMTYEADQDGVLQIVAGEGDTLAIGELIARIGDRGQKGEDRPSQEEGGEPTDDGTASEAGGEPADDGAASEADEEPADDRPASEADEPAPAKAQESTAPANRVAERDQPPADRGPERVKASPVARRMASDRGVDLASLTGSGPGGRIVKADVEGASATVSDGRDGAEPTAATGRGSTEVQELSRAQQVIARRMAESRATIPDFTLQAQVDMEAAVEARAQLDAVAGERPVPSLNDMVVKACALALREFPRANGSFQDGSFELHSRVNVGVAVATEEALVVPTVFDADSKPLGEIARETRALAERVRDGRITPPELSGATFTVSNLGMFGIASFTAVINPPQAAILAVGSAEPRAVVHEGQVVARHTMALTLGCDHRILYGADAARFLGRVRTLLEQPAGLAL